MVSPVSDNNSYSIVTALPQTSNDPRSLGADPNRGHRLRTLLWHIFQQTAIRLLHLRKMIPTVSCSTMPAATRADSYDWKRYFLYDSRTPLRHE